MRKFLSIAFVIAVTLAVSTSIACLAQTRPFSHPMLQFKRLSTQPTWAIAGKWTYRSYLNRPDVVVDDDSQSPQKAFSLIFGEGIMTLTTPAPGKVLGTFDMGGGSVLDLSGSVQMLSTGQTRIVMSGLGRAGTPTAGWEYDYEGYLTMKWPKGVAQIPAIVGSVFRAKPHNGQPAGIVASFISLKQ